MILKKKNKQKKPKKTKKKAHCPKISMA